MNKQIQSYDMAQWDFVSLNDKGQLLKEPSEEHLHPFDLQLISDAPKLATRLAEMEQLLTECHDRFMEYAKHHFAKKTLDSIPKYEVNLSMGNKIKTLLEKPL